MTEWFTRPILPVTDVETTLRFFVDRLGFTSEWSFSVKEKLYVAQAERQGCAVILSNNWPEKIGKAVLFISLNVEPETYEAACAALDNLRAEFAAKGAMVKDGWWGYKLLVVDDPDGNQLLFNYPNKNAAE